MLFVFFCFFVFLFPYTSILALSKTFTPTDYRFSLCLSIDLFLSLKSLRFSTAAYTSLFSIAFYSFSRKNSLLISFFTIAKYINFPHLSNHNPMSLSTSFFLFFFFYFALSISLLSLSLSFFPFIFSLFVPISQTPFVSFLLICVFVFPTLSISSFYFSLHWFLPYNHSKFLCLYPSLYFILYVSSQLSHSLLVYFPLFCRVCFPRFLSLSISSFPSLCFFLFISHFSIFFFPVITLCFFCLSPSLCFFLLLSLFSIYLLFPAFILSFYLLTVTVSFCLMSLPSLCPYLSIALPYTLNTNEKIFTIKEDRC